MLTRRATLAGALALSACVHTGAGRVTPRDVILVHGAWHGAWCWAPVAERLRNAGHRVIAPTLPGLGEDAAALTADTNLADHIDHVAVAIEAADVRSGVLVGHSYGGMVITGAADRLSGRLRALVYLDAAVPRDGQTFLTQDPDATPRGVAVQKGALRSLAPDGIAMAPLPPATFGIPPEDEALTRFVAARLTPHPLRTWLEPIRLRREPPVRDKHYVHCVDPPLTPSSFAAHYEQKADEPGWTVHELRTGHDAMLTAPGEVARLLMEVSG